MYQITSIIRNPAVFRICVVIKFFISFIVFNEMYLCSYIYVPWKLCNWYRPSYNGCRIW